MNRPIRRVAVLGAGVMGSGIAAHVANAGIPVHLLELKQEALDKGLAIIRRNYENQIKKNKLTQDQLDQRQHGNGVEEVDAQNLLRT